MVCPIHPSEILKEDVLPELGITVTEAASQLGVTRVALPCLVLPMVKQALAPTWHCV
jgi:plasmid maintenance system antidote protein VapI